MEHTTPTDPDASGARPKGVMRCLTTPGNTIDPRIEALAAMATDRGMMSLCQPRKPDPVVEAWLAGSPFMAEVLGRAQSSAQQLVAAFRPVGLEAQRVAALLAPLATLLQEIQRGPTIGRKRRARRARGRARQVNHTNS